MKMFPLRKKHVVIKISDDGCGMSNETIKTIFNPFFTTKPNGTGLGLSIVHRILESYDSQLVVESKIDIGTIFTINLHRIDPPTNY
ncbi:MAG: ATP-binding protein, partial [Desulfobacterales bacterium]